MSVDTNVCALRLGDYSIGNIYTIKYEKQVNMCPQHAPASMSPYIDAQLLNALSLSLSSKYLAVAT